MVAAAQKTIPSLPYQLVLRQSEPSLPPLVIQDRRQKVPLFEIRPEGIGEIELGIRRLPEEKIADSPFTACADNQVRVRQSSGIEE